MNQPEKESNYGYRIIPKEEYATFKRCEGLQVRVGERYPWDNASQGNHELDDFYQYRLKIHPGDGWEIVGLDEIVEVDYEATHDGIWWKPILASIGSSVRAMFKNGCLAIRRKLPIAQAAASPQPAPWIKFGERRPSDITAGFAVQVTNGKDFCLFDGVDPRPDYWTHWRLIPYPKDLPQPEKSESQLAFEKLFGPINEHKSKWKGWQAAIAFTEARK